MKMELTRERIEKWRGAFQYEFCASAETNTLCDLAIAGLDRPAAPVNKAVSEDGFMACAEHGPYHVDDSEAFQCPACGAAIKAPAAPASQGADND